MADLRTEMLQVNESQRTYYENATGATEAEINSRATNLYRRFRRRALSGVASLDLANSAAALHREWLGDVSKLKVLDLGVGDGNALSLWLAKHAREYVAIDLSRTRIARFEKRLADAGITGAKTYAVDFLSPEFPERDFDVIYAMAVLHHFQHPNTLAEALHDRLTPQGRVVTYDPQQTWLPARIMRGLYRPFQTDRAWEFPFTSETFAGLQQHFTFERVQGLLGRSKWSLCLGLLSSRFSNRLAAKWHDADLREATTIAAARHCLHLSLLLRRRDLLTPASP